MKKLWFLLIPFSFLFLYTLQRFTAECGVPYWYNTVTLILAYVLWILLMVLPAAAVFAVQLFVMNRTESLFLRLIPAAAVLLIIAYEWFFPFYGALLGMLSDMVYLPPILIIPAVIAGLLAGWLVRPRGKVSVKDHI